MILPDNDTSRNTTDEEVMLGHYLSRHSLPENIDVDEALADVHQRINRRKPMSAGRQIALFLSGVAAAIIVMICLWHTSMIGPSDNSMTLQLAAEVPSGITIEDSNGSFYLVPDKQEADPRRIHKFGAIVIGSDAISYSKIMDADPRNQVLSTPSHRTFKLTFHEGTEVTLDASSQLSYPTVFSGDERQVVLRGQAYFKVAKDAAHPFVVKCENYLIRALGTEFNVRYYNRNDAHVTLVNGLVEITDTETGTTTRLAPGEDVVLSSAEAMKPYKADLDTYCLWSEGTFYFDNITLLEVAKALGTWYNMDVVFVHPKHAQTRVHFVVDRTADITETITLLNSLHKVTVSMQGNRLVFE